jgi:predicted RNA-binding Zn-ribbon protein involved in translation (DUF1610 family)
MAKKMDEYAVGRTPVYKCTSCGMEQERSRLSVKRIQFLTFGRSPKVLRSRTAAWLCPDCRERDVDWNRKETKGGIARAPEVVTDGETEK